MTHEHKRLRRTRNDEVVIAIPVHIARRRDARTKARDASSANLDAATRLRPSQRDGCPRRIGRAEHNKCAPIGAVANQNIVEAIPVDIAHSGQGAANACARRADELGAAVAQRHQPAAAQQIVLGKATRHAIGYYNFAAPLFCGGQANRQVGAAIAVHIAQPLRKCSGAGIAQKFGLQPHGGA